MKPFWLLFRSFLKQNETQLSIINKGELLLFVQITKEISSFNEICDNTHILGLRNNSHKENNIRMSQLGEHVNLVIYFVNQILSYVRIEYLLNSDIASFILPLMHNTKTSFFYVKHTCSKTIIK